MGCGRRGRGGVRRVWDVARMGERNTIMGCGRSGRLAGGRKTCMGFDRRRNMSMGCRRSGRRGSKVVYGMW